MSLRGRFQFHLSTAALGMLVIGVVMPKVIAAFRRSTFDGVALVYALGIPFVLLALEFENFLARQKENSGISGAEKLPMPKLTLRFPVLIFGLELTLIGLWAFAAARAYALLLNAEI